MITAIIGWTTWTDISRQWYDHDPYMCTKQDMLIARQVVVNEIRSKGYKLSGFMMQDMNHILEGKGLVPVFNDNTKFKCTLREWGYIMSDAYPEESRDTNDRYLFWAYEMPADYDPVLPCIILPHVEIVNQVSV